MTLPSAQLSEQAPSEQTLPGAHAWSQSPQWLGFSKTSTQAVPQARSGAPQAMVQAPSTQAALPAAGSGQAWPHAPQLPTSFFRSKQLLPQGENGLLQAKLQLPSKQMPAPLAGALQVAPQPPQFCAWELVSTQAPLQATSSLAQLPSPEVLLGAVPWPRRTHSRVGASHTYPLTHWPCSSHALPSKLVAISDSHPVPSANSKNRVRARTTPRTTRSSPLRRRCNP